jgi:hypothetical protein
MQKRVLWLEIEQKQSWVSLNLEKSSPGASLYYEEAIDTILRFMFFVLTPFQDANTKTYYSLCKVLFLLEIWHTKRKANEFVADVKDGLCLKLMD